MKKLLLLSSFLYLAYSAPVCAADASKITCEQTPSCTSLGYNDTITASCSNPIRCPYDSTKGVCLDDISPIKSFSNCKVGQYLTSANNKIVCSDYPIGGSKKIVTHIDSSYVYYFDPDNIDSFNIPLALYDADKTTNSTTMLTAISQTQPTCKLIPSTIINDNQTSMAKLKGNDIFRPNETYVMSISSAGSIRTQLAFKAKLPTKYLCARGITENGTVSIFNPTANLLKPEGSSGVMVFSDGVSWTSSTTISTAKSSMAAKCMNKLLNVPVGMSIASYNGLIFFSDVVVNVKDGAIINAGTRDPKTLGDLGYDFSGNFYYICDGHAKEQTWALSECSAGDYLNTPAGGSSNCSGVNKDGSGRIVTATDANYVYYTTPTDFYNSITLLGSYTISGATTAMNSITGGCKTLQSTDIARYKEKVKEASNNGAGDAVGDIYFYVSDKPNKLYYYDKSSDTFYTHSSSTSTYKVYYVCAKRQSKSGNTGGTNIGDPVVGGGTLVN